MRCDQAVFTSVRTATGQGYRIIAASPGLTPEERAEISARSPSHGGLCSDGEDARAAAYYGLKSGRLCAALSCSAGREQSGRGGLRIFTRTAVFAADQLARFGQNPFNVLRAMDAQGLGSPELNLPQTLPMLLLGASAVRGFDPWSEATEVGPDWLACLLHAAMSEQPVVLATDGNLPGLLETVVGAVPASLRRRVSFSYGLKFSIGRSIVLNEICGDTAATERVIRGHAINLVRPCARTAAPTAGLGDWECMALWAWRAGEFAQLERFATEALPECSRSALDTIAALRNERIAALDAEPGALLDLAERRLSETESDPAESRFRAELFTALRDRLEEIWSQAGEAELAHGWQRVRTLMLKSAQPEVATTLAGLLLRRLATVAPPLALQFSLSIADDSALALIGGDLRAVLSGLEQWGNAAPPAELRPLLEKLKRWHRSFPHIDHAAMVLDRLTERAKG